MQFLHSHAAQTYRSYSRFLQNKKKLYSIPIIANDENNGGKKISIRGSESKLLVLSLYKSSLSIAGPLNLMNKNLHVRQSR